MDQTTAISHGPTQDRRGALWPVACATLAAAAVSGLVFALWADQGSTMFASLVQIGLATCF